MSGPLEEGFAKGKVAFGYREVEQRHKPRILPCRRGGTGYRARHDLDEVLIAPVMEVAEETVAPIVFPADEIYRVYGGRLPGGIAVAKSTVVAVNRKLQRLGGIPIIWRTALYHVYFPILE